MNKITPPSPPAPAIGQIWEDADPRSSGRRVLIVEIDGTHAVVKLHAPRHRTSAKPGRQTRIRLDRFRPTSTGYRYVAGPEGGAR